MDNFNWRGILAGLTEEQREFLKSLPLSEYIGLICRHVLCSECPLSGCNGCIKLKRIELIRRAVKEEAKKYWDVVRIATVVSNLIIDGDQKKIVSESLYENGHRLRGAIQKAGENNGISA